MASLDIFGNPISGDQHSKFFKTLINSDLIERTKTKISILKGFFK